MWLVTFVVSAHLILGVAVLLLAVIRSRGEFAITALVLVTAASAAVLRRDLARRRLGILGGTVVVSWALGAIAAWAADRFGLY